jgi:hypothetical protein
MSLIDDLDDLMFPFQCKFPRKLTPDEWYTLVEWCNDTCGKNKWWAEQNLIRFRQEEHMMLFLLRWA